MESGEELIGMGRRRFRSNFFSRRLRRRVHADFAAVIGVISLCCCAEFHSKMVVEMVSLRNARGTSVANLCAIPCSFVLLRVQP